MTPAERTTLLAVNEAAAAYFRDQLLTPQHDGPRRYLSARGFRALLTPTPWTVGYAPPGCTNLYQHLRGAGFTAAQPRDHFRDRIIFGVRNAENELVGFVGRASPGASHRTPKYLNTAKTELYSKGDQLFGLGELVAQGGPGVALTEGPLDAIAIGLSSGLDTMGAALCGTALTQSQARTIGKHAGHEVAVALDRDAAGDRARILALFRLQHQVGAVTAPQLPRGLDPAGVLQLGGSQALRRALLSREPLADELIRAHIESWRELELSAESRLCCLRSAARLVVNMKPDEIARQAARLARSLDLSPEIVTRELTSCVAGPNDGLLPVGDAVRVLRSAGQLGRGARRA
jgi:DNA primase catalytic core